MLRICKKCTKEKEIKSFSSKGGGKRSHTCNSCRDKKRAIDNPVKTAEKQRRNMLMINYKITPNDYNQMFEDQLGKCKICDKHQSEFTRRFAVDHCHDTNVVRGLLCSNCNRGIGLLKDSPEILQRASEYLKEFK